jgi:hypothetical protein
MSTVGLERERIAVRRPVLRAPAIDEQIATGQDEPFGIAGHEIREDAGPRRRADEDEDRIGRNLVRRTRRGLHQRHGLQPFLAVDRCDDGPGQDIDIRGFVDSAHQVLRHGMQAGTPHDHGHLAGIAREEHRPLARGVGAANDEHIAASIQCGLGQRRAVVDAGAGQFDQARHLEPPHLHAGREQDCVAGELGAVGKANRPVRVVVTYGGDVLRGEDLRAEPPGLRGRAMRRVGAAETAREAQVVLDSRAGSGLAARRVPLDEHGTQAFRCGVDRAGQPGRTTADDDEIVELPLRACVQPDPVGQLAWLRLHER